VLGNALRRLLLKRKYEGNIMSNEDKFLITYGLHNFVTHAQSGGKHIFMIRGMEGQKLISHAKSLIAGSYGPDTDIQVA
jgi:hypothetical protein